MLDVQTLWNHMVDIANENPDFVYTEQPERNGCKGFCGYAGAKGGHTDGLGCIVGQGLSRMGYSPEDLLKLDRMGEFSEVAENLGVEETPENFRFASMIGDAQAMQDYGKSFSEAIAFARNSNVEED